jgi:hypothetical protein
MKQLLWIALVALSFLALPSCKTSKASQKKAQVQKDFLLRIEHTGCRGMCPVFTYEVAADGATTYEGRRAVEREGKWSKKLPAQTLTDMAEAINSSGFWDMDAVYGGEVADLPSVIITFTHGGKTHKVQNIRNAPEAFTQLAEKLENWIGQDGWEKAQ